jgi:hypothetical protein
MEGDAVLDAVDDAEGAPGDAEPDKEARPVNEPVGDAGTESVS